MDLTGGGRWLVYSINPADNTLDGLSGDFSRYPCAYSGTMETLVIRFIGPFPRPLDWPLAKTTRHNPDNLLARWLGRYSLSHFQPGAVPAWLRGLY